MTTTKKHILFVDDDPRILVGLEGLFRKDRARWEMVFALGGQCALEVLGRQRFDVVVTDMRMPEVDGAAVLHAVADQNPAARRILLTGYADDLALAQAAPVLDQLLDKPCTASELRAAIDGPPELEPRTTSPIRPTRVRAARGTTHGRRAKR